MCLCNKKHLGDKQYIGKTVMAETNQASMERGVPTSTPTVNSMPSISKLPSEHFWIFVSEAFAEMDHEPGRAEDCDFWLALSADRLPRTPHIRIWHAYPSGY